MRRKNKKKNLNILLKGYCPLAKGAAINDETIKSLGVKYSKTPGQIAIKWSLEVVIFY